MGVKVAVALLLGQVLLATSLASATVTEFHVNGPLRFPGGTTFDGLPRALFTSFQDAPPSDLIIESPKVHVREMTAHDVGIDTPAGSWRHQRGIDERTYTLTNVTITLIQGAAPGFVGLYPRDGHLSLSTTGTTVLETRAASGIGNGKTPENGERPDPGSRFYNQSFPEPSLFATGSGVATFRGAGWLKASNVLLHQYSSTNSSQLDARWTEGGLVGESAQRWVLFSFDIGNVTLASPASIEVVLETASFAAEGQIHAPAGFRSIEGAGSFPRLAGAIEGEAAPDLDRPSTTRFLVRGEFTTPGVATFGAARAPVSEGEPGYGMLGFALAGVVVAGAATGLIAIRRKKAGRKSRISKVNSGENELAQESLMRAFIMEREGDVDRALALYDEAGMLTPDGTPSFRAALLCARHERNDDAAENFKRAVRRTPLLVYHVADDPALDALVIAREDCQAAVDAALRALDKSDLGHGIDAE